MTIRINSKKNHALSYNCYQVFHNSNSSVIRPIFYVDKINMTSSANISPQCLRFKIKNWRESRKCVYFLFEVLFSFFTLLM